MSRKTVGILVVVVGAVFALLVSQSPLAGEDGAHILSIDHYVPHVSTVPANAGELGWSASSLPTS